MMSPNNEKMDEEKSFEVIQEGVAKHFENEPHLVRKGLTEVSAMFDRTGKGYLDETERALRRMDSQDKGYLGIDKVCVIFESLQSEQERSSQLLEALRTESKKSLNLKMAVMALSVFSILLALANVGTSFAVATMVKDTQVSHGDLLDKATGERVATTSKLNTFEMHSIEGDESRRRHLQQVEGLICETQAETVYNADGTRNYTEKECALAGVIDIKVADNLHQQLRTQDRVVLSCNLEQSVIKGILNLPSGQPGPFTMGSGDFTMEYKMYPTTNPDQKYDAVQRVFVPARDSTVGLTRSMSRAGSYYCDANFDLGIYCPTEKKNGKNQECLVMTAYQPTDACPTLPVICGPKRSPFSYIN